MTQSADSLRSAADSPESLHDVFIWDIQFETGIPEIDLQHRKLVQIINSLGNILRAENETDTFLNSLFRALDELADYVNYHFRFEEDLMARFAIDENHQDSHKHAHAEFIQQIAQSRNSANEQPVAVTGRMLTFLSKWLINHIIGTDMRTAKKILAIQTGLPEAEAALQADNFMRSTTEVLLNAMNHLYENLANRTQALLESKRNLHQEIEIRKLGEIELRKLTRAIEYSPVSIIITNANGEFEYVNPKFEQLTGYSLSELTGKTPRVLKSGQVPDVEYQSLWETISAGKEWHGELQNRKKNGELYWDYTAISPVFDPDEQISHYVSIQENITQRKLVEASLRQQKQLSDDIINSLPGVFYMLNLEGRFVRVNPQFLHVTGYTREEFDQLTALDLFEGEDKILIALRMQEVFLTGDSSAEAELMIKSGQKIPYYFSGHRTTIDGEHFLVGLGTDITERRELSRELSRQAKTDSLTAISNRRHFFELAELELARAKRYGKSMSLLMLDLDEFKKINDTYGHLTGDNVLRKVVEVCRNTLREVDVIGRIGGEEFAIMLPETDSPQALEVAERLRQAVAIAPVAVEQGGVLNFTTSIGVATLDAKIVDVDNLLDHADKALYEAKRSGRNKVCAARQ